MDIISVQILLIQFFPMSKVLFAHISTSNYFWCACLHQITIITKCNYILLFHKHHKYFNIFTKHAQILLLLHNILKYYYHTICSNTTIMIAQRDWSTKIDVGERGGARGGQPYVRVRDIGEWALKFNLRKWWDSEPYIYMNMEIFITHVYIHTCIYIYVYVYIYIYIYICMYIYIYIYTYACTYNCVNMYIYIFMYTCIYIYVYMYIYICMYKCVYIYIFMYTYIYLYIHMYMYVCTSVFIFFWVCAVFLNIYCMCV